MKKNTASQIVGAQLNSKTDGSAVTTGTTTVYVTGDGGTQATGSVGSGAATHEGQGFWTYAPAQAETNYDHVAFTFANTNAVSATVQVWPSFPQTGDNFARLGAPAGASVSADIAAVKVDTAATLVDTNELQTDWVNGGRLDNILDARASQTSVDDVPTNSEFNARTLASADYATAATQTTILADTNELQTDWANGGRLDLILDARASQTSVDDVPTTSEFNARTLAAADYATAVAVGTVDTVVDAIQVVTDKLHTTLQAQGASSPGEFQFSASALELAPAGGGSGPTAAEIADAVWDENLAAHAIAGSTGEGLADAGAAGNPWNSVLEGSFTAEDLLRICAAVAAGKTSIVTTSTGATVVFRDASDASNIVSADMTGSERTSVTLAP